MSKLKKLWIKVAEYFPLAIANSSDISPHAWQHEIPYIYCCIGVSLKPQHNAANEEIVNAAYDTITDHHIKKPVEQPIGYYAEVIIPSEVKLTTNPAYAVPWSLMDYIHFL